VLHPWKQLQHSVVIEAGMITSEPFPKYSKIELPSKFSKKRSDILKFKLSSAIKISSNFVPENAKSPKWTSAGGIQKDESDEQFRNADFSIRESLDLPSNRTLETVPHPQKQ
jgi:hypothetical protein